MSGEGSTYGINGSYGATKKKFSIKFSKTNTKFCLSLNCNGGDSCLFVNGPEMFTFKGG